MASHPDSLESHIRYIRIALSEAEKCVPTKAAFCVGCVLVTRLPDNEMAPTILAAGFSRELPGNTHAEANALAKTRELSEQQLSSLFPTSTSMSVEQLLAHTDVYTTMEPCSIRTSGLSPCADALIAAKVKRCFIGVGEPDDFVNCEGAVKLKKAGIKVIWIDGLQEECLSVARRGHEKKIL